MNLHIISGMWWPIACPPYGAFVTGRRDCIIIAVRSLMTVLTYPWWCTMLYMVQLVTYVTRGLPDTVIRDDVLTY